MEFEELPAGKNIVVAGIGNSMRGDDGISIYVARQLKKKGYSRIYICQAAPENYLTKICDHNPNTVLFIDAVELGENPGKIKLTKAKEVSAGFTTHNAGLDMVAEFISNDCGADIYIIAVQPESLEGKITGKVREAGDKIVNMLEEKLCMNQ